MAHQNENENVEVGINSYGGKAQQSVPAELLGAVSLKAARETTAKLEMDVTRILRQRAGAKVVGAEATIGEDEVTVSWTTPGYLLSEHHTTVIDEIQDSLNTRVAELLGEQDQSTEPAESGHEDTKQWPKIEKIVEKLFEDILDPMVAGGCDEGDESDEDDCGCGCDDCDDENDFGCGCGDCGYDEDDHKDDTLRGRSANDIATAVARVLMRTQGVPMPVVGRIEMELSFTGIEKISLSGEYDLDNRQIDEDLTLTRVDDEIAQATAELVREHRLAEVGEAGVLSFTGSLTGGLGGPLGGQGNYRLR